MLRESRYAQLVIIELVEVDTVACSYCSQAVYTSVTVNTKTQERTHQVCTEVVFITLAAVFAR